MKKQNNIMTFKKFLSYFNLNESSMEARLNAILSKISKKVELSKSEKDFLDNYSSKTDEDYMDYKMISKDTTVEKINKLLDNNKLVICNIPDRDGPIGKPISSIDNDYRDETCNINFKDGESTKLKDNFLYNIIYNPDKDNYTLEAHDEYYEKIPIKR